MTDILGGHCRGKEVYLNLKAALRYLSDMSGGRMIWHKTRYASVAAPIAGSPRRSPIDPKIVVRKIGDLRAQKSQVFARK